MLDAEKRYKLWVMVGDWFSSPTIAKRRACFVLDFALALVLSLPYPFRRMRKGALSCFYSRNVRQQAGKGKNQEWQPITYRQKLARKGWGAPTRITLTE